MKLLTVEEVMKITGMSKNHCYIIMRKLRKMQENENKGVITFVGKIEEEFFKKKLGIQS